MSMNCKRYEQDLFLLAHGQLESHEQARVREHLHTCAACGERLTQLTGVSFLIADAVHTLPTPPSLTLPSRPSFFVAKPNWLLSVFLGACIVFSVFSVWKSAQSYASPAPGFAATAPNAVDTCDVAAKVVVASPALIKGTPCPKRHRASVSVVLSPSAPRHKP